VCVCVCGGGVEREREGERGRERQKSKKKRIVTESPSPFLPTLFSIFRSLSGSISLPLSLFEFSQNKKR
jgi:hypothetical protein